ncbi:MAG: sugar phosphate isomerase/epimerase [Lentisphaerae bacterium]|jgi:sugar phosphate isomerase/epimerase|nr:sugar phosphate isomerase/epimerase [Lentisphaerota bacterium]
MVPVTHVFEWAEYSEKARKGLFREFGQVGAKHLVLTGQLLGLVMQKNAHAVALKQEIADAGMSFNDGHALFGVHDDLCLPFEEYRPMMISRHSLALEACALMEVKTLTIHVGNGNAAYGERSVEELHLNVRRGLEALLPVAERCGVVICIENIWSPLNDSAALLDHIEYFNSPWLGICYDAGHANLMARDPGVEGAASKQWAYFKKPVQWDDKLLEKILPHVVNCHLHDNLGVVDDHILPFQGTINWEREMSLLAKAPRLQVIQNEVLPMRKGVSITDMVSSFDDLMKLYK